MTSKQIYKKIVDEILKTVKRHKRPIMMEEIAEEMDISREHFSRLYNGKYDITKRHVNGLLLRYPEVKDKISQAGIDVDNITSNRMEEGEQPDYSQPQKKKPVLNPAQEDVSKMIDTAWKLSDSVLINSKNLAKLIEMNEASYNAARQNSLASDPSFPKLVDLLWKMAEKTGKWEENQFRAMVASSLAEMSPSS